MQKPSLAIIGRPNVGKSTLFNRIIRKREAIVNNVAGVTRDRIYVDAEWSGIHFTLIDTGGYLPDTGNLIHEAVLNQVMEAIREADVILFLADVKTGVTNLDVEISRLLRKQNTSVLLGVNKVDNDKLELDIHEFYSLGLGDPIPISAANGRNIGDLLDVVIAQFPDSRDLEASAEDEFIKLAIVGKPNVGKSSFVNALLGAERLIVTEIPGTTRDSIDTEFKYEKQKYRLIDTAGLRKRSKVRDEIEYYSTVRTVNSIRECNVAIVLVDAVQGVGDQDKKVIEHAIQFNKGIVLAVNKWDLIEKDMHTAREFELEIRYQIPYIKYLPILFISALTKQRVFKTIDIARSVHEERQKRIKTSELNDFLAEVTATNPPPAPGGKYIKIKYCVQVKTAPPVFAFFCNYPKLIKSNYRQYLENKLRERFGFFGVPITLTFKKK
ncbi:ribosome biogenesis GTPase Der [candidate division KSB1 bacterium]|nr:ribosome biogenesis GTPase Der [candidate division KSB1 bacterium]